MTPAAAPSVTPRPDAADTAAACARLRAWAQALAAAARAGLPPEAYRRNLQLREACTAAQHVLSSFPTTPPGAPRWPPSPP